MSIPVEPLSIGPATAAQRQAALAMIFRDFVEEEQLPHLEQLMATPGTGEAAWEGLLVAHRGDTLVAALLWQPQPGNVAILWFPRWLPSEPASTAEQLLASTSGCLHTRRIGLAQCMMRTVTQEEDALLRGAGFKPMANLLYLVSTEADFPQSPPAGPLTFEPYSSQKHTRLAQIIDRTYEATLDCPLLNGIRPVEDVLAGYRASGTFDPSHWLIITHKGQDVGSLLITEYPEQGNCELIYMGLVPEARGHRWGMLISRHAQWLTRSAGRQRLVLAVDAANRPAIRMYSSTGFRAWDRRTVYLQNFSG